MSYAILIHYDSHESEWFSGSTYTQQGKTYPIIGVRGEARRYPTLGQAKKAAERVESLDGGIERAEIVDFGGEFYG